MLENREVRQLFEEVTRAKTLNNFEVKAEVLVEGKVREEIPRVTSVETTADYTSQISDYLTITTMMGPVFYKANIDPYKDNLQIHLTVTPKNEEGIVIETLPGYSIVYNAYPMVNIDSDLDSGFDNYDLKTSESGQMLEIPFQLITPILDEMLKVDVSDVYRNTTVDNLLRGMMSYGLHDNQDTNSLREFNYQGVRGVDIVPVTNTKTYESILVPVDIRLPKLTKFIQNEYGIYGTGCGCYFQRGWWFIYPLYEMQRFEQEPQRLNIVILDQDEAAGIEQTFMREGETITILATGKTANVDNSERIAMNKGDSVRMNKASELTEGYSVSNNMATGRGGEYTRATAIEKRKHGIQNTRYARKRFTDNPYPEFSEIAALKGRRLSVNWEKGNPAFLKPAMPVRVVYLKNGEVTTVDGTLHGYSNRLTPSSGNFGDTTYANYLRLALFIEKNVEE